MTRPSRRVLYVIVCGSPVARDVGKLVELAQSRGWEVCVIGSPSGARFIDIAALQTQTGHPVRSEYKDPLALDLLPSPDAIVVAPATCNTINKWAAGISDTLALGIVVEAIGKGVPIATMPFTNWAQAAHPAFVENLGKLRAWGVSVLFGDDVYRLHEPGAGDRHLDEFPWSLVLDAVTEQLERQTD